jgi:hypothetical protein
MSFHVQLGSNQRASFGEVIQHGGSVSRSMGMDIAGSYGGSSSDGGSTSVVVGAES